MIGEFIKHLREQEQLSQKDLAEALSLSRSTVANWECGNTNPSPESLADLADYFGCEVEDLENEVER